MRAILVDVDYVTKGERARIRLMLKKKKMFRMFDDSFEPYFYLMPKGDESETAEKLKGLEVEERGRKARITKVEKVQKELRGMPVTALKITCSHPWDVAAIREKVKEFGEPHEHRIPFARRYMIDRGLSPFTWVEFEKNGRMASNVRSAGDAPFNLKTLSFDIETYNPQGMPREKKDPVIMISYACEGGDGGVITHRPTERKFEKLVVDEKAALEEFVRVVKRTDAELLFGYNSASFDLPYLKARAEANGVKLALGRDGSDFKATRRGMYNGARIIGRLHVDLYPVVRFLGIIGTLKIYDFTLRNAYSEIMGKEKIKVDKLAIWKMWDDGEERKKLADYSMSDAQATLELGRAVLPMEVELSKIVRAPLLDVCGISTGQLVELLLTARSHSDNVIVPNRPGEEEVRRREMSFLKGAYVKMPKPGIYEDIAVFDFRGLYPSIICSHNIDPFTINCGCCAKEEAHVSPTGDYFCKKKQGLIPKVLGELVAKRGEMKREMKTLDRAGDEYRMLDARQQAFKILANSFYGMLGYARSRWYSLQAGESVTAFGRRYIQDTAKKAEDEGYEVLYIDTDSLFLLMKGGKREDVLEFMKKVNAGLPGNMELELEGFYKRGVFVAKKVAKDEDAKGAKKKYAMIDGEGNIKIRGFELVRRDWSDIAKKTQRSVLEAILKDGSKEKAVRIVKETVDRLRAGEVPLEELVIHTQLKKSIGSYEIKSPELSAAKKAVAGGMKYDVGSMVGYVITRSGKTISDKARVLEMATDYDAGYYIDHQVLPSVLKILKELGYDEDDLKLPGTQSSLGEF
ncbi:MAG: DNA-directed DNA polymerase [Candidatus Micrarchaeota archaeon]|nr:DNA-directed DNA polymerase [Candidatus Micrarchaeota archaeon]